MTYFSPLIQDANFFFFSRFFTQLLYSHTKMEDNNRAHNLTKYPINVPKYGVNGGCFTTSLFYTLGLYSRFFLI